MDHKHSSTQSLGTTKEMEAKKGHAQEKLVLQIEKKKVRLDKLSSFCLVLFWVVQRGTEYVTIIKWVAP